MKLILIVSLICSFASNALATPTLDITRDVLSRNASIVVPNQADAGAADLILYNIIGVEVHRVAVPKLDGSAVNVDLQPYPAGWYFVVLQSRDGQFDSIAGRFEIAKIRPPRRDY